MVKEGEEYISCQPAALDLLEIRSRGDTVKSNTCQVKHQKDNLLKSIVVVVFLGLG